MADPATGGKGSHRRAGATPGTPDVRLPYSPGLDGLRAFAVIAVLLYHADLAWIPGGFLGVEVFLPGEVAGLRGDVLAAFGYVTNWYLIFGQESYFEAVGRTSLLQHLWSL